MEDDAARVYGEFSRGLDNVRKVHPASGTEYWMARDIQAILGYDAWDNFKHAIERARKACGSADRPVADHFLGTMKKVQIGSGAVREIEDCFLSRFACYLIAMNAESTKREVGFAQTYFAVQARRQEQADRLAHEDERLELRHHVIVENKLLAGAAKGAGVRRYPIFQDAGIRALYGGLSVRAIKRHKNIGDDDILDRAGMSELSANFMRSTLTRERLEKENVMGEGAANAVHADTASKLRSFLRENGATMPEDLPPEPSIKKIQSRRKADARASQKRIRKAS